MFLICIDVLKVGVIFSWQGECGKPAGSMMLVRMNMCCEIQICLRNRLSSFDTLDQAYAGNR